MNNEQVKRDNRKARCIFLLGKGSEDMPSAFPTSDRQCRELMKASAALKTPQAMAMIWKECTQAGKTDPQHIRQRVGTALSTALAAHQDTHNKGAQVVDQSSAIEPSDKGAESVHPPESEAESPRVEELDSSSLKGIRFQKLMIAISVLEDLSRVMSISMESGRDHEAALLRILQLIRAKDRGIVERSMQTLHRRLAS